MLYLAKRLHRLLNPACSRHPNLHPAPVPNRATCHRCNLPRNQAVNQLHQAVNQANSRFHGQVLNQAHSHLHRLLHNQATNLSHDQVHNHLQDQVLNQPYNQARSRHPGQACNLSHILRLHLLINPADDLVRSLVLCPVFSQTVRPVRSQVLCPVFSQTVHPVCNLSLVLLGSQAANQADSHRHSLVLNPAEALTFQQLL